MHELCSKHSLSEELYFVHKHVGGHIIRRHNMSSINLDDDYYIIEQYSLKNLKELGVDQTVIERLQDKKFINLENDNHNLSIEETMEYVELLTDFYLGTILNKEFSEQEVKENIVQIGLPKEFWAYEVFFKTFNPLIKWKNLFLIPHITEDHEIYIECYDEPLNQSIEKKVFNITS